MSSLRAIGGMVKVPYLHRIEYIAGSDGSTTLVVNRSVYVGRFNSLDDAKEVVKGILTKLGCNRPDERILTIPTVGGYSTPNYDWSNMTGSWLALQPNNVLEVTSGLDATVTFTAVTFSGAAYRVANSTFLTNDYITNSANWTAFTSGATVTATAGQFVGFTKQFASFVGTDTFTVTDNITAEVIDTFTHEVI